jgi:copper(I)-binding protein
MSRAAAPVGTLPAVKRSHRALGVAALAAAAVLTGCMPGPGFNATSIKPYAPSDGVRADSGDLRIANALVVADNTATRGLLSTTIVNRGTKPDELTDVTSPDADVSFTGDGTLAPGSAVRLGVPTDTSDPSATFSGLTKLAGETITVKLTFRRADPVTLHTFVVTADGPYASITPSPTASPSE